MLFAVGFLMMFLIGGINGAFSAAVPVDFAIHDTYWVVAHIHYVLFGGSVFGDLRRLLLLVPEDVRAGCSTSRSASCSSCSSSSGST